MISLSSAQNIIVKIICNILLVLIKFKKNMKFFLSLTLRYLFNNFTAILVFDKIPFLKCNIVFFAYRNLYLKIFSVHKSSQLSY